mmetsp:Transcript_110471/g.165336  ORF Transcript_110471/g.165336 Transcript_110471/m.165336 type:complete len:202 (-) Transcript_110471:190-795(-)
MGLGRRGQRAGYQSSRDGSLFQQQGRWKRTQEEESVARFFNAVAPVHVVRKISLEQQGTTQRTGGTPHSPTPQDGISGAQQRRLVAAIETDGGILASRKEGNVPHQTQTAGVSWWHDVHDSLAHVCCLLPRHACHGRRSATHYEFGSEKEARHSQKGTTTTRGGRHFRIHGFSGETDLSSYSGASGGSNAVHGKSMEYPYD